MKKNAIIYREARFEDIPDLIKLEKEVWGEEMLAEEEKWISRISIFSEGVKIAVCDNSILGVVVTHIVKWDYPDNYYPDWFEVSGDGLIGNHDITGDTVYGIDLTVLPGSGKVANNLMDSTFELRRKRNKKYGMLGSRIPSLSSYAEKKGIKKIDKNLVLSLARIDPTVNFFVRCGLSVVGVKEEYFSPDLESCGWGVILKVS